jgi:hypothetical protein
MVTVSPAAQDVLTIRAAVPVEPEYTYTPLLIVNVKSVLPAMYPEALSVLTV